MIANVIDELTKNAREYFAFEGHPVIDRLGGREYNNSGITILRVRLGTAETIVYVKRQVVSEYNRLKVHERVVTEFDIMKFLHDAFRAHPGFSVARPVAVFPEQLILVTEACAGLTLEQLLTRATRLWSSKNALEAVKVHCRSSGKWLALFHEFTKRPNEQFNVDGLIEYCDVRLKLLVASPKSQVDRRFRDRLIQYLRTIAKDITLEDSFVAGRHNDFLPQHIFVDNGRLTVIDMTMFDYDSIYYDLCSLWHKLETMKIDPFIKSTTVSELQRAFLDGYGKAIDIDSPIFKAIQVRRKVTKMLEIASSNTYLLHRRIMDWKLYNQHFDWLVMECDAVLGSA